MQYAVCRYKGALILLYDYVLRFQNVGVQGMGLVPGDAVLISMELNKQETGKIMITGFSILYIYHYFFFCQHMGH